MLLGTVGDVERHRHWRRSMTLAVEQIESERGRTRAYADELDALLAIEPPSAVGSQAWLDIAEGLLTACWSLGEAIYCACEWAEPDEAHPDPGSHDYRPGTPRPLPTRKPRHATPGLLGLRRWAAEPAATCLPSAPPCASFAQSAT